MKQNWRALLGGETDISPSLLHISKLNLQLHSSAVQGNSVEVSRQTCHWSTQVNSSSSVPCQTSARAIIVSWSCDQAATHYWTTSGPIRRSHKQMRGGGGGLKRTSAVVFRCEICLLLAQDAASRQTVCVDQWKHHQHRVFNPQGLNWAATFRDIKCRLGGSRFYTPLSLLQRFRRTVLQHVTQNVKKKHDTSVI